MLQLVLPWKAGRIAGRLKTDGQDRGGCRMSPDKPPEARGNPVLGHKKGSPFADGPLFAKAADLGAFALFRENADLLRALNKRLKLFRGEDGWFARGRNGQVWEWGRGKLGFTVKTPRMVANALEAGFVATQRGDQEANFSCPWEENIDRLIKLLRLKIRRPASVPSNPFQNRGPEHRNGKISGDSEWIESLPQPRPAEGQEAQ
jgi:hypothetical protein